MTMPVLNDDQIVAILAAGGGLRLKTSAKRPDVLAMYASNAKAGKAHLTLVVTTVLHHADLVMIASAGGGMVSFEWPD